MDRARAERDWSLASAVMCLVANCHRDPKKPAYAPRDFNPLVRRNSGRDRRSDVIPGHIQDLKVFVRK